MISLSSPTLKFTGVTLANPHRINIPEGITAVIGPNGAGKTSFAKIIEGGWNFMTNDIKADSGQRLRIRRIEFSDIHSLASFKVEYYQQRFEAAASEGVPTVADLLGERITDPVWGSTSKTLGIEGIESKHLNYLSSGELRKMLIANMLLDVPDLLILDNPYIGLDAPSRSVLDTALKSLADSGVAVLLLVGSPAEIPAATENVIPIKDMQIGAVVKRSGEDIAVLRKRMQYLFDYAIEIDTDLITASESATEGEEIVRLEHCRVAYGKATLLSDVSWTINRGERWALSGPNGAGKSTLLSLINADNPQSYSNSISLFGRKRGSGESIWDIKRHIGFLSPERHLYFNAGLSTALEVAAGGLKETLDHFRPFTPRQLDAARRWLEMLRIGPLAHRKFTSLSFGEQRLVLIVRTLIRCPQLMILDEPLHGLDAGRKLLVNAIIDEMARINGATLIYVTHYTEELPACISHHKEMRP